MRLTFLTLFFLLFTIEVFAENTKNYLLNFYNNIYSLKSKGVKDLVVDVRSSELRSKLNELKVFGDIKDLYFRVFWTSSPERFSVEVMGLPEGFKEIKENLKQIVIPYLEEIIPQDFDTKYKGFEIKDTGSKQSIELFDSKGLNQITKLNFFFDKRNALQKIVGTRPAGEIVYSMNYQKKSFSGDKWVLESLEVDAVESGIKSTMNKNYSYENHDGFEVLKRIEVNLRTQIQDGKNKDIHSNDAFDFKNYKLNTGLALKYFLGENVKN